MPVTGVEGDYWVKRGKEERSEEKRGKEKWSEQACGVAGQADVHEEHRRRPSKMGQNRT
jgi:hypothetical protein